MNLRKQIQEILPSEGLTTEHTVDDLIKISNKHAILFLDWYGEQPLHVVDGKSTEILLKIYENKKGL